MWKYSDSDIYYAEKGFIKMIPVANVIKLFCIICGNTGISLFIILMAYAGSGLNYTEKSFIVFIPVANVIKHFWHNLSSNRHNLS